MADTIIPGANANLLDNDEAVGQNLLRLASEKGTLGTFGLTGTSESSESATLAKSRDLFECGKLHECVRVCEEAYAHDARDRENLLLLGAAHYSLGNFSEGIFYNQQAIRVDSSFAEAYSNLGNCLRELGDIQAAVEFYLKAIKLKPRLSDAYNNLACAYLQLGRTKQATETFQMALVLQPGLVDALCNLGTLHRAQGKMDEARKCFLEAVKAEPGCALAWSGMAGIFYEDGELDTAIGYYEESIRLRPDADTENNFGNALRAAGRLDDARAAYKRAIALRPDFAVAHANAGILHFDTGDVAEAIKRLRHALLLEPSLPDALNSLGSALAATGDADGALDNYRRCIRAKPDHPHAYNNLGVLLRHKRGMLKEATQCFATACKLMPKFAAAQSNLASALQEQGKIDQALAHYQEAIAVDPTFAAGYCNLGCAYRAMGRTTEAIKCFTTAIRLDAKLGAAYHLLGCAYRDADRCDDAISCFRKALVLKPGFPDASVALAHTLAIICDWRTRKADALAFYEVARAQASASSDLEVPPPLSAHPSQTQAFALHEELSDDLKTLFGLSGAHAARLERILDSRSGGTRFKFRARKPDERLRVGYVSAHLGNEPLGFALQGLFSAHDENEFEIFVYAASPSEQSRERRRIEREAEHFCPIDGLSAQEAAKTIHADGIHVLIDLDGYAVGARTDVFALRPAPIQIAMPVFHLVPLCASFYDFVITDEEIGKARDAPRSRASGELVDDKGESITNLWPIDRRLLLPRCLMVADHKDSAREVLEPSAGITRSTYGLEESDFVFACFTRTSKIDPQTFATWCNILERVPRSVLWLLETPKLAEANLKAEVRARGIREDRLVFAKPEPRREHLQRLFLADLVLDTPLCNHHASALDVLWAGVPLLTCTGPRMASRVVSSMAKAVGLDSRLTTSSMQEYEDRAVEMAKQTDALWRIRKTLEQDRLGSQLFDVQNFANTLEKSLAKVWVAYEGGDIASL
ncbi:UDP-N-acetylglucosamine--peptide N-acetylglucosaminyltransferase 110 kDa subunit [Hondaea fermentalgiana]|uniref:protein O-GlcNAc transferase n=1 Tax=Hondaea fermentalgiana TaxID=2315210 RepID=A0A2R5G5C4_9STRA|nr:UDP-N-acetylglucosamine--peptide N-acetylglucosaminyltransferase 110 kDa subunit [Hondaea fermentalgiana]|eukprot:GBG26180.1 UDP-N-acetylglucosamine--peptide N-acetylglucosaminyltransferase 110 kDa subunit [Hondaea fermentalgiana]